MSCKLKTNSQNSFLTAQQMTVISPRKKKNDKIFNKKKKKQMITVKLKCTINFTNYIKYTQLRFKVRALYGMF